MARSDASTNGTRHRRLKSFGVSPEPDPNPSGVSPPHDADLTRLRLRRLRSAITNGSKVLADVDHRSPPMRRLRDLISDYSSDLGNDLTTAELALVRRAAMLELQLEMMETSWIQEGGNAGAKSLALYGRTTGNLRRVLQTLGLERRSKDVTRIPTIDEYAEQVRAREADA
jgi:ribosomal protein L30/L7E